MPNNLQDERSNLLTKLTKESMPDADFILACRRLFYLLGREKQSFTARKYIERELRDHLYGLKRCGIGMHDEGMMELFIFKRNIFTSEKLIEISACPTCNGKGVFVHSFSGDETETRVCARCNGNGIA